MLAHPSTPVPLRLAKRIVAGIIIVSSAYVAAAILNRGLEFGFQTVMRTELSIVASLTQPAKAHAAEEKPVEKKKPAPAPAGPAYVRPAQGKNWSEIHSHNGIDISNKCGTPVVASAAGTVSEVNSGWNGGYGNAVVIKHKKTRTHYAHLSMALVKKGESVSQGEVIGYMGDTGKSTGCHLHFEVWGGTNPFGK